MGSKVSCFLLCNDCRGRLSDEKAVESSIRQSQLVSVRGNISERSQDPNVEDAVCGSKDNESDDLKAAPKDVQKEGPVYVHLTLQELLTQTNKAMPPIQGTQKR